LDLKKLEKEFENALLEFDRIKAEKIFRSFDNDRDKIDFINSVVVAALKNIGDGWESGKFALSQIYMSGKICEELVESLKFGPVIKRKNKMKTAIATLEDHHKLGKRMVMSVLNSYGYNVIDYGHGVTVDELKNLVVKDEIDILMISVLMLPSALKIKDLTDILKKERPATKVVVGGAPFTLDEGLWKRVGANFYGKSAADAVEILKKIAGC